MGTSRRGRSHADLAAARARVTPLIERPERRQLRSVWKAWDQGPEKRDDIPGAAVPFVGHPDCLEVSLLRLTINGNAGQVRVR